ncbi:MAG: VanZ family protein [Lachnospiraceae bacterium]|nr:VanZ family protein [Lachnospiraceae bacterium]
MNIWAENIISGIELYINLLPLIFIITAFFIFMKKGSIRPVQIIGTQCLVLYLICLINMVLFPLPGIEEISGLNGYNGQFVPFKFVADIAKDRTAESILQVLLNIIMTVPFGFFFKFFLNMKIRNVILITFLFSLIIELAQLTGLFFIYPGSYRLFDVDDLMTNTLGGFLGTVVANSINDLVPYLDKNAYVRLG